jgi:hypothetical protein
VRRAGRVPGNRSTDPQSPRCANPRSTDDRQRHRRQAGQHPDPRKRHSPARPRVLGEPEPIKGWQRPRAHADEKQAKNFAGVGIGSCEQAAPASVFAVAPSPSFGKQPSHGASQSNRTQTATLGTVSEGAVFRPEPHGAKSLRRAVIAVPWLRMVARSQVQLAGV